MQTDCLTLQVENRKRKIKEIKLLTKYLNTMKKIYFLFLFALIASMSGLQAQEEILLYETGFESSEGFEASTNYNNDKLKLEGPANQQWGIICGTPSTNSVISGDQSMQMRYYKSVGAAPYVLMDFDLQNVSKVVYKAKTANESNNTLLVQHSTDGGDTWSEGESYSLTTSVSEFTYVVEGENTDVRFKFTATNTPVEKKGIIIDDVKVYGEARLTAPVISGVVNGETYYGSATVSISYPELATSMSYTITKDGTQYKQETVNAAVEGLALNEAGAYKVEATATDGTNTTAAEAVEFTIVDGAEYTVTGAETGETLITTEGAEGTWTLSKSLTYGGKDNGNRGWQIGSSDKPMEKFTLTLDKEYENIVSVIVNAATGGSCTLSVSVGGNAFGEEVSLTNESADYEFTGNASGNVTLNFNASEKACYLKSITIISTKKESVVCATPEFSLAEGTYNETQTLTITSSEGSTIVYSINDGETEEAASPATITLEAEATAVTYEIVAHATMDGAEESETVTKTYTIDPTAQIEDMDFATIVSEGGHEYGNGTSCYEFISGDVTVTSTKGSVDSRFWENKDVFTYRFYGGATLTVSVPAKYALTKIEFVADEGLTSMTTETGNYSAESVAKAVWMATDEVSSVTFSTTKTVILEDMIVYYKSIPAGVEGVEAADAAIRTNADGVVVTADGAVAEVYNAAGQLVAAEAVDGERVIALPAGFYIVRVGDATAKVVVK